MKAAWLALLLALPGAPAQAGDDTLLGAELDPISRDLLVEGAALERAGQWSKAEAAYGLVLTREPGHVPAVMGLGRVRERRGDRAGAERAYASLPMEAEAVQALAALLTDERPAEAADLYLRLRALRLGEPEPYRLEAAAALRAGQLDRSAELLARYIELDGASEAPSAAVELHVALAGALKEAGRRDEARAWLERAHSLGPDEALQDELRARLDRIAVEEAAETLAVGGGEELPPALREQLSNARRAMATRSLSSAQALLDALLEAAPRSPEVHATRGDLLLELGEVAEAERAFLTALALHPEEPAYHVRLGRLLAARYAGRRHREAIEELRTALTLRPAWHDLRFELATLLRESGEHEQALDEVSTYLARAPDGQHVAAALALRDDLTRQRPSPPDVKLLAQAPPEGVPEEAWAHFKLAQVYLRHRGDDARAREEVERALAMAPDYVDALNLLATLQLRAGQQAEAFDTWQRSLAVEPDQPLTLLAVGESLRTSGRPASAAARFEEAAALGAEEAWFALAALAADQGDWLLARRHLDEYFARSSGGRVHGYALELKARLDDRLRWTLAGVGGALGLAFGAPTLLLWRRRTGATLKQLLDGHPSAYHDVASVLSRMRHEVIKHNTTVLPVAVAALEAGDPEPARAALEQLLDPEEGAVGRWWAAIAELEDLSARLGLRPGLRHRDEVLAPMCAAVGQLGRARHLLRRGRRARAAALLDEASRALNHEGYRALGRLIREVCVLPLDEALLRGLWQRLTQEPAFQGQPLPALELEVAQAPIPARVFRQELEDIVINLLRNALQAVLDERPPGQRRVGLTLRLDLDHITGLERAELRFLDNAVSPLSDDMIRGRYIARGFGLTVDLVNRSRGAISVQPAPGWSKAIVVYLPCADPEEDP